jgi:hypothetical protein
LLLFLEGRSDFTYNLDPTALQMEPQQEIYYSDQLCLAIVMNLLGGFLGLSGYFGLA